MIGLHVKVPIVCFRKGLARDFWESEQLPPPATCYGFLLSLVGEEDKYRHCGVRIAPALLSKPDRSVVLRTAWRVKTKSAGLGNGNNRTLTEQELLSGIELAVWIDSSEESRKPTMEERVYSALKQPEILERFGGLSFGESIHLVDEVTILREDPSRNQQIFSLKENGRIILPVWVDHIGAAGTKFAGGEFEDLPLNAPSPLSMPIIDMT